MTVANRWKGRARRIPGEIVGGSHSIGHRLRDRIREAPKSTTRIDVAIVGGGISGLSAAWRLNKRGKENFILFELDDKVGGNSRSGANAVSAFPWGAHYVPLAGEHSPYLTELFEDCGVITGRDPQRRPIYNEYYLCAAPHERLYRYGQWHEGLVPLFGASREERAEIAAFQQCMEEMKYARGRDGRAAFAIPIEESSSDPRFVQFDRVTMAEFLRSKGWRSTGLHWYVDYCCRDDYGMRSAHTSAWAGIHYFASRAFTASNVSDYTVLTWPEGNGWLVNRLREFSEKNIQTHSLVTRIAKKGGELEVDVLSTTTGDTHRYLARDVIYAAPRFTAPHVIEEWNAKRPDYLSSFEYAPWMVANLTMSDPAWHENEPPAWDNVLYHGDSLGYINATHQSLSSRITSTVLTYYLPLCKSPPSEARKEMLRKSHAEWSSLILKDLGRAHPTIERSNTQLDIWLWGHAMIRPKPGLVWGEHRKAAKASQGRIHFAHSDMSGISIFEEAQYWGVRAADRVLGVKEFSSHA